MCRRVVQRCTALLLFGNSGTSQSRTRTHNAHARESGTRMEQKWDKGGKMLGQMGLKSEIVSYICTERPREIVRRTLDSRED